MTDVDRLVRSIGLDPDRDLARDCADFYLLEEMASNLDADGKTRLHALETDLALEFATYLDMAVGGESRHAKVLTMKWNKVIDFSDRLDAYFEDCAEKNFDRPSAWKLWITLRRDDPEGTRPLIREIAEIFKHDAWGPRPGAGGRVWAEVADVLWDYMNHRMKPRTFVDRCWTLQHNNAVVFDKVYKVERLGLVLVTQAKGEYRRLASEFADSDVRRLWYSWKRRQLADRDPQWLGVQWNTED